MTPQEFDSRLSKIDQELAATDLPVLLRPIRAWFMFTGRDRLNAMDFDPTRYLYEGPNLMYAIDDWYRQHFPAHATIPGKWSVRHIMIRGDVFRVNIPMAFNARGTLDVFDHVPELSELLRSRLTIEECEHLQKVFDAFYEQQSTIELCIHKATSTAVSQLVHDLLLCGQRELLTATEAFTPRDPATILWPVQQASEKFLKAFLALSDISLTEQRLSKKPYGHDVESILTHCVALDSEFQKITPHIHLLDFSPKVRYHPLKLNARDALDRMNLAIGISHFVACKMLQWIRRSSGIPK